MFNLVAKTRHIRSSWFSSQKFYGTCPKPPKKVAVVLSGCGMLDGSEIHEAAAVAVHLSRFRVEPVFYAPLCPQADVVDHWKKCPVGERRIAIVEGARIARGNINPLCELQHCDVSAVVFPGGFGAAKTLSTFATDGPDCAIDGEVMRILQDFHDAKKPMAFMCIAAILPARLFPCVKVTLGKKGDPCKWPHSAAIDAAMQMGASVEVKEVTDFCLDKQRLIFSTPAFMYEGPFCDIFDGIGVMIDGMYKIME